MSGQASNRRRQALAERVYRSRRGESKRSKRRRAAAALGDAPKIRYTPGQRRTMPGPGRNGRCPCGSGKKFKRCCGRQGA
jgi:uncharacterized protein YecA (UPF0149 family)